MQRLGVEQSMGNVPAAKNAAPAERSQETAGASRDELLRERNELLVKVQRLEAELARYRSHAQRMSKMFQSVTAYAEWIRERARRDAELTLKKARARADRNLGDMERERYRTQRELLRLQALTDETRKRLSAFTAAALDVLNTQVEGGQDANLTQPVGDDLQDALHSDAATASQPSPAEAEKLEP